MKTQHNDLTHFESMTTDRYAIMQLGRLSLLIPQHQVHTLEPMNEVQPTQGEGVGWLEIGGERSPVYCLSEDLQPIPMIPADRSICVVLDSDSKPFGLLCNQVSLFKANDLDIKPLPECMCTRNTPLRGLVLYDDKILCITYAHDLLVCLNVSAQTSTLPTLSHDGVST